MDTEVIDFPEGIIELAALDAYLQRSRPFLLDDGTFTETIFGVSRTLSRAEVAELEV
jgi:hypothetical protein